ncbi:MAG: (E)-4-hydroxy-3-methylbut-2-enyl-diphosphate synthase [Acidobacteria bacterium]|nr:MAG: (E)-4-hydroxy-3-methylbut-2-enyl-diphosphate synthase [Acidobacteriota bacterium]
MKYCPNPYLPRRRMTRTVHVGDVAVGGDEPIRVQSMTTPATGDLQATVEQMQRLADAGCEIVRVTVPTVTDAGYLPGIKAEMRRRGVRMPVVADIHFSPAAAMASVEHVEKVRVNPGNYVDSKRFEQREYTDAEYAAEVERIAVRFLPLVDRARELGVAIRVGTNHGSLSDRIMNRFGDSPAGMVESAMEFLRIARDRGFHDLVLSMKSSNPTVMIQAYRLLAARMDDEGMDYPFHLGVTEAGEGEDGRVKSAVGIGSLLEDGIGDTIRVSLTEDPVAEISVARELVAQHERARQGAWSTTADLSVPELRDPYRYARRSSSEVELQGTAWGGDRPPQVEVLVGQVSTPTEAIDQVRTLVGAGVPEETRPDLLEWDLVAPASADTWSEVFDTLQSEGFPVRLSLRLDPAAWSASRSGAVARKAHRLTLRCSPQQDPRDLDAWMQAAAAASTPILWEMEVPSVDQMFAAADAAVRLVQGSRTGALLALRMAPGVPLVGAYRLLAARLFAARQETPLVLLHASHDDKEAQLASAALLGSLLCDGLGDAVRIEGPAPARAAQLCFTLLQGTRLRLSRTEFISCPSCGRTLFDLESTTQRIKEKTGHLKGVKIAIMGCIVNGPGEMADADFGYVGGAPDKVNLFVGQLMVARHVPAAQADDRLIDLIKQHGKWVDPPALAM